VLSLKHIHPDLIAPFVYQLSHVFERHHRSIPGNRKGIKSKSVVSAKKIEGLNEKYYVATVWVSSPVLAKEKLRKLIFPKGIIYDLKKQAFRITKVNLVFQLIASNSGGYPTNKTG
jgi:hypothetical protein